MSYSIIDKHAIYRAWSTRIGQNPRTIGAMDDVKEVALSTDRDHPADPSQPGPERHRHFSGFDGLRALAAGAVLLHHAGFQTGYGINRRFGELLAHGDAGVSIFFLISGFLLYRPFVERHLSDDSASALGAFWWRRALRIFPGYWVALIGVYLIFGFGQGELSTAGDFVTYFGLTQIYDTTRYFYGVNQAWTLATELSFYLFLPLYALGIRAIARRRPARKVRIEAYGLIVLVVTCVVWRLAWWSYDPFWTRYGPDLPHPTGPAPFSALATQYWLPSHLDLFAMGMLLALVSAWVAHNGATPKFIRQVAAVPWLWWMLAAATYWVVSMNVGLPRNLVPLTGTQYFLRQFLYGLMAFFLLLPAVFGEPRRGLIRKFLVWTPVAYIGLVSYGVYLWHQAIIGYVRENWLGQTIEFQGALLPVIVIAGSLTVAIATLSYYLIERPVLRWKNLFTADRSATK